MHNKNAHCLLKIIYAILDMVFAQHLFNGLINEENVKINNINEGDLHLEGETPVHDNVIDDAGTPIANCCYLLSF